MTTLLMKQCADTAHVQKPGLVCFTKKQNFVISKKKINPPKRVDIRIRSLIMIGYFP